MSFKHTKNSHKPAEVFSLWHSVQEWIRQEIVDDDPYDEETLFPSRKQQNIY